MNEYVISDTHLGHGLILTYSNRPFKSTEEMNAALIREWNMRVHKDDLVYHIGDFCFKSNNKSHLSTINEESNQGWEYWKSKLNGNIIWIKGNHDPSGGVKTHIESLQITFSGRWINMVHKPEHSKPEMDINLVGHVHQAWKIRTFKQHYDIIESLVSRNQEIASDRQDLVKFLEVRSNNRNSESILFNVGVDVNNFRPVKLDEVIGQINKWKRTGEIKL